MSKLFDGYIKNSEGQLIDMSDGSIKNIYNREFGDYKSIFHLMIYQKYLKLNFYQVVQIFQHKVFLKHLNQQY